MYQKKKNSAVTAAPSLRGSRNGDLSSDSSSNATVRVSDARRLLSKLQYVALTI
jgi:hypothetical protein